jgi:hypothetical protein
MKPSNFVTLTLWLALIAPAFAEDAKSPTAAEPEAKAEDPVVKHQTGSTKVADDQDELSADVQQLTIEQTMPKVIALFKEVEGIMDEATDWLAEYDTGGRTIAAQTEVVEKIFEATKERQKQQGKSGGAMMEMMKKMTEGQGEGEPKKGSKPGDKPGQGNTGDSDAANGAANGAGDAKSEARRVPKAAGTSGAPLPEEFRKALDAYNRGMTQQLKLK